jgi:membrane protease YdiL (CAAX protease family)
MTSTSDVFGTPPGPPQPPPLQIIAPEKRPIGAAKAILILVVYLISQVVGGAIALGVYAMATGADVLGSASNGQMDPVLFLVAGFVGFLIGGPLVVVLARAFERGETWSQALAPLGMVRVAPSVIAKAGLLGVAIALFLGFALEAVVPSPQDAQGPLVQAASAPGWQRILFVLLAILLAPVFEEFLFRGVMYTGMSRSWGRWPAAIVVTLLFGLMHAFDVGGYWPALVIVSLVGVALLALRIKTKSLIPPMVMHATYNGVQVLALYLLS